MKNLIIILVFLAMFTSCKEGEEVVINEQVAFENNIGFISSKTGEFVKVNKNQITSYWKQTFEIDDKVNFDDFKIIKGKYTDTGEDFYLLKTINTEGTISIATKVTVDNKKNALLMDGKSCKCESVSCTWNGCDASYSGDNCICSSCSGDCKKTSTVTKDLSDALN